MNEDRAGRGSVITMRYDKQQFKQLAQIMVNQYQRIATCDHRIPSNIKQMYLAIMIAKQKQMQTQRQLWSAQFKRQSQRIYRQNQQYILHASEQQIESMTKKDLKILQRLINIKNQKNKQLAGLGYKYDELLDQFRKLKQKYDQSEAKNKALESQKIILIRKNTQLELKIQEKNAKIQTLTNKLLTLSQILKKLKTSFQEFKNGVIYLIRNYQKQFIQSMGLVIRIYLEYISKLENTIKILDARINRQREQSSKSHSEYQQIIKKLVVYLSQATKFPKKQNQTDLRWFLQFQRYKTTQKYYQQLQLSRSDAYSSSRDSSTSLFIRQQQRKNQNYIAQYINLQGLQDFQSFSSSNSNSNR